MNKIWLTGDAVVDLIPNDENTFLKCPGGAPANVAVTISRLNGNAHFFGRVGNDPLGRFLQQVLKQENVAIERLVLDEKQRTSTVIIDLDDSGERSFTFMVKPSADQFVQAEDIPSFSSHEWLHVCSIALANEPSRSSTLLAMKQITQAGGYVSFDPNIREEVWNNQNEIKPIIQQALELADVIKFSDDELMFLTETSSLKEGLEAVKKYPAALILITQGAKGTIVIHDNNQQLVSGKIVTPIDTTGAGDAFIGGVLTKLTQVDNWNTKENIQQAVIWGNACGAIATTKKGAMTALPLWHELDDFLTK